MREGTENPPHEPRDCDVAGHEEASGMRIAVARETDPVEDRVAATPDTVKKMKGLGAEVAVEPGAGTKSGIPDTEFIAAGATVVDRAVEGADVVLKVRRPTSS